MYSTVVGNYTYKTTISFKGGASIQISLCKVELDELLKMFKGEHNGKVKVLELTGYTRCPERKEQVYQKIFLRYYEIASIAYYHGDEFLTI